MDITLIWHCCFRSNCFFYDRWSLCKICWLWIFIKFMLWCLLHSFSLLVIFPQLVSRCLIFIRWSYNSWLICVISLVIGDPNFLLLGFLSDSFYESRGSILFLKDKLSWILNQNLFICNFFSFQLCSVGFRSSLSDNLAILGILKGRGGLIAKCRLVSISRWLVLQNWDATRSRILSIS